MDKNDYKQIVADQMTKCAMYEEAIFHAVGTMEEAAKHTTDPETFKALTIGFEKIKTILGINKENNNEQKEQR